VLRQIEWRSRDRAFVAGNDQIRPQSRSNADSSERVGVANAR